MRKSIFLQVRLSSVRLPEKALLPLGGKAVISLAMEALSLVKTEDRVLLTDYDSAPRLEGLAKQSGWELYAGDPDDVLGRFVGACRFYGTTHVLRATGDNPLVNPSLAELTWDLSLHQESHYCAHLGMALGTGVEAVTADALIRAYEGSPDAYEREHVCPYLYRRPDVFRVVKVQAPREYHSQTRLTLDTPQDYQVLMEIFDKYYQGQPLLAQELGL